MPTPVYPGRVVMHLMVEDPKGPMASGRPWWGLLLEQDLGKVAGLARSRVGHPGRRFRFACSPTLRLSKQDRGMAVGDMRDLQVVSCPACRKAGERIIARREAERANPASA